MPTLLLDGAPLPEHAAGIPAAPRNASLLRPQTDDPWAGAIALGQRPSLEIMDAIEKSTLTDENKRAVVSHLAKNPEAPCQALLVTWAKKLQQEDEKFDGKFASLSKDDQRKKLVSLLPGARNFAARTGLLAHFGWIAEGPERDSSRLSRVSQVSQTDSAAQPVSGLPAGQEGDMPPASASASGTQPSGRPDKRPAPEADDISNPEKRKRLV